MRQRLLELIPDEARVTDSVSVRDLHARDLSYHPARSPDVVVYPITTDEVAAVVGFAGREGIPVTAFGAGTSVEGNTIPVRGGIALDLTRMDRLLAVRPADLTATVQPGVLRSALNQRLATDGLFFPVDPGADASLGGMAATNASGTTTVRYGGMRANVLALEVVLADGSVVRTGTRARKTSAGYDLNGLFIGSEGTLGVITELTLRVQGIPEYTIAAVAVFDDLEAACRTAVTIVAAGVTATRVELLDGVTLRAVNAYKESSFAEAPTLFIELSGTEAGVLGDAVAVEEIARAEGCTSFTSERDTEARNALWEARHHAALAVMASQPGKRHLATDVCVPISELPGAIALARSVLDGSPLVAGLLAHAGDGNYHLAVMFDPDAPADRAAVTELNAAIIDHALTHGGTCTGEHGVGLGKIAFLEREHGDLLPLMRGIKQLLDPAGILNPGKLFAEPPAK